MKKFFSILVALVAMVSFQSCVEDETDDHYSAKVVTLDATDVSEAGFTFHATIDYSGGAAVLGNGGVFFAAKPNVTKDSYLLSTETKMLKNGSNKLDFPTNNVKLSSHHFSAGDKLYYRAYAKVFVGHDDVYVYGEEKSVVIPE